MRRIWMPEKYSAHMDRTTTPRIASGAEIGSGLEIRSVNIGGAPGGLGIFTGHNDFR